MDKSIYEKSFKTVLLKQKENINNYQTSPKLNQILKWQGSDYRSGRFPIMLYRFLTDNIPSLHACLWTWVNLTSAPGEYSIVDSKSEIQRKTAMKCLSRLSNRIFEEIPGQYRTLANFVTSLCLNFYRDGFFGGFVTIRRDGSGIDRVIPVDPARVSYKSDDKFHGLILETEGKEISLNRPDFFYIPNGDSNESRLGQSLFKSIPFIAYIEQQLIDDMRRSNHNAGYHRLHVKVSPPERIAGESDQAYIKRIDSYFDKTVSMIRDCDIDENPVTWDNVQIDYIGPSSARSHTNSWFMSHRALIEEICGGTNLAPFLLGYSYGATSTWASFKLDLVMRQVQVVQQNIAALLSRLGNLELALKGIDVSCRYSFDNTLAYQASDIIEIRKTKIENILKLYQAGLIDKEAAAKAAEGQI